jgi:hypothetical protein
MRIEGIKVLDLLNDSELENSSGKDKFNNILNLYVTRREEKKRKETKAVKITPPVPIEDQGPLSLQDTRSQGRPFRATSSPTTRLILPP